MKLKRFHYTIVSIVLMVSFLISLVVNARAEIIGATTGTISVDAGNQIGTIKSSFYGNNLTPYLGPNMPQNQSYINKAIPQQYDVIRIPGGYESDAYKWWTAISYGSIPEGFSCPHTDQFQVFAQAVGARLQIAVNYGSGTPLEAANWVEYTNGAVPSAPDPTWTITTYAGDEDAPPGYFAWMRAQRGHAEPYGVQYWEIGNEIYSQGEWDRYTNHDPVLYAQRYIEFYDAMKAVDPTIKIGLVMDGYDWWLNRWNRPVMQTLGTYGQDKVDFLVAHWYPYWNNTHPETSTEIQRFLDSPSYMSGFAAQLKTLIDSYCSGGHASSVELALTEFAPNAAWPTSWDSYNVWGGLWTVIMLAEGQQSGWSVMNFWNFAQGDSGYSMVSPSYLVDPEYWGYDLMTHFGRGGDELVTTNTTGSNVKVYASKLQNGSLSLLVVNKDQLNSFDASIDVQNYSSTRGAKAYWYDRSVAGSNNTSRSQTQNPPGQTIIGNVGNNFTYSFPPLSATIIVLNAVDSSEPTSTATSAPIATNTPTSTITPTATLTPTITSTPTSTPEGYIPPTSTPTVTDTRPTITPTPGQNIGVDKPVTVSSIDLGGHEGPKAVDGNIWTRWSSAYADNQWISIDLEAPYPLQEIVLKWEVAYGKDYDIQVSSDGIDWTTVYEKRNGTGGEESLPINTTSRYVRIYGLTRGTQWGFSLWEIEVFSGNAGPSPDTPTPTNTPLLPTGTATEVITATPTETDTPLPPTETATAISTETYTPLPPTETATAVSTETYTPLPPTETATAISTETYTPLPPTETATELPVGSSTPSPTATNTPGSVIPPGAFSDDFTGVDGSSPDGMKWDSYLVNASNALAGSITEIQGNRLRTAVGVVSGYDPGRPKARNELRAKYLADWSTGTASFQTDVDLPSQGRYEQILWAFSPTIPTAGNSVVYEQNFLMLIYSNGAFEAWVMRNGSWAPNYNIGRFPYTGRAGTLEKIEIQLNSTNFRVLKNGTQIIPWTRHNIPGFTGGYLYLQNASSSSSLFVHLWDNVVIQSPSGSGASPTPTSPAAVATATPTVPPVLTATATASTTPPVATSTPGSNQNLALRKSVAVSSIDMSGHEGPKAVDGDTRTRWSSSYNNNQWIRVDLGEKHNIVSVVLNWEVAYGRNYDIQVSDDGNSWTTIYARRGGAGGRETLAVSGAGRFIRMFGITRGTQWGFSLWEFEVYGSRIASPANLSETDCESEDCAAETEEEPEIGNPEGDETTEPEESDELPPDEGEPEDGTEPGESEQQPPDEEEPEEPEPEETERGENGPDAGGSDDSGTGE